MSVVIIDYGLGNLTSVYNALNFLGANPKITESPHDVKNAEKIILPGVGAFGDAMLGLEKRKLIASLKESISKGKIYLGICLGLQILFEESEEGEAKGLGILKGKVKRFQEKDSIKVPQIGWNRVKYGLTGSRLQVTNDIDDGSYFYFDHSYYGDPLDKRIVAGTTDYGIEFSSFIWTENIYAVQFHPERSQKLGLKFLENFLKL